MRPRTAAAAAVVLFGIAVLLASTHPGSVRSAEAVPEVAAPFYGRTGFWFPASTPDVARDWLAPAACGDLDDQAVEDADSQHLGADLRTGGPAVYAIDDGEIIGAGEEHGVGVVFARHRTADGEPFVSVYGGVTIDPALTERLALGEVPVAGGAPLPGIEVSDDETGAPTVHLGVVTGTGVPPGPWLERPCADVASHRLDGFVDPLDFLARHFADGAVAGPVDLRSDCLARGGEAAVALRPDSAGSWVCVGRRVADVTPRDVAAACRLALGDGAAAVRVDDSPHGWRCSSGGGDPQPVDLDAWCDASSAGGLEATTFNAAPFDADSWRCVRGVELGGFDFARLCREGYDPNGTGRPPDTAATAADFGDPASWRCFWTTRVP